MIVIDSNSLCRGEAQRRAKPEQEEPLMCVCKATLKELGIDVLDWPPYSPDLNVIEVIWAIMEARIEKKNPKSIDELKQIIIQVWESISWGTINGLINSMNKRLKAVNANPKQTIYRLNKAE